LKTAIPFDPRLILSEMQLFDLSPGHLARKTPGRTSRSKGNADGISCAFL
jgi:hypothetical protein